MKKSSLDISIIGRGIVKFLNTYHLVLFIVLVGAALGTATYFLSQTVLLSKSIDDATTTVETTAFDKVTIDRLRKLDTSVKETKPLEFPSGRINPFTE